jgi:ABC-2 type transport system ATP-binding protein
MSEPAIRCRELKRDFGRVRAVDRIDLAVETGRVVALLGPNGAGKSTLLKLVSGLLEPTAGEAEVFGEDVRALSESDAARLIAMHENHEPPRWATAARLFDLQAAASPQFDRARAEAFCRERDLSLSKPYGTLSKGQKRWVLAAATLAARADLMLLDEPADGLDPSARRRLYDALRETTNTHESTAVVATHIIHDIERVADDVAIIDRGRLRLFAPLEDLREQVREVELPAGAALDALPPEIESLGTRTVGDTTLVWLRAAASEEAIREIAGPEALVRPVGLEALFLALTERAPAPPAPQPHKEIVQ